MRLNLSKKVLTTTALVATLIAATACGESKQDRAASGALLGAGGGALIGSTVGAPVTGAAIGAGVGATVGAVSDKEDFNLGKPIWR